MNIKPKLDAIKTIHKTLILMALFSVSNLMTARNTITGTFPQLAGQTVKLTGFEGLQTYTIATTTVDASGKFTLYYNSRDRGMGYLSAADDKAFFVVLEPEDIILEGIAL